MFCSRIPRLAVNDELAAARCHQADNNSGKNALAGAGKANGASQFTFGNVQGHMIERWFADSGVGKSDIL